MQCASCGRPSVDRLCPDCSARLAPPGTDPLAPGGPAPPADPPGARPPGGGPASGDGPTPDATLAASPATLEGGVRIGRRYEIVRLLGRGGMGAVYLARDHGLGRDVALKVVAAHLADDPGVTARFVREIQLSSLVTHPNVLRVYDLGEADGLRFLTMQYVEGETLADLLKRERPLPVPRCVAIFRQVCEGLLAAHERKVLHRDLKPQNVLLDREGRVFLTDFGLATSSALSTMTRAGAIMGTPQYMSPEQVKGEPLDERSDVFSLGVMLYEMLAGKAPYSGDTLFELMMSRTRAPPRPARAVNPAVPPQLQRLIDRCLAIDPALRYGSVREVLRDLDQGRVRFPLRSVARRHGRRAAAVAGAAALAVAGWAGYRAWSGRAPAEGRAELADAPMVGVVPFANRTEDRALDWVGEGIARLVADGLSASRHLRVASPQRLADLRGAEDAAALLQAAAGGGLQFVVTGEVLARPGGFTVASRLTDVRSGKEVASGSVDAASRADVVGAARELSLAVRRGLRVPLAEGVDHLAADFATRNFEAYEAYVLGLRDMAAYRYRDAERRLREALRLAPDFTMARFRLANVLSASGRVEDAAREIRRAAGEASRLSDREARYVRAAEPYLAGRFDEAARQYEEMIARYPYEIEARLFLAKVHEDRGDWPQVIAQGRAMAQIDPRSPSTHAMLGWGYLGMKDYNQAIGEFRRYAELDPANPNARHLLADAYRAQGVLDLAAEEYRAALRMDAGFHFATVALAQVEVLRGSYAEAERLLAPLAAREGELPRFRIDASLDLASVLRAQGRFREAARTLERAEGLLRQEKVREAMALAVRALCALELGDLAGAEALARTAVERSPGAVATRYLHAAALVQLRQGRLAGARATADRMAEKALPPSDPDRTEERAAAHVRGLAWLEEGRPDRAREELARAVSLTGHEYASYRLSLARAYLAAGAHAEALASAKQAGAPLDPVTPRLDLELDRVRAHLVEAQVAAAMGRREDAAAAASRFLAAWSRPDAGLPEAAEARRLGGRGR
jgi:tetratricopeptide (TPR) repeat protein